MSRKLSPLTVVLVIAVVVLVVGLVYMKGSDPSARGELIDKWIANTAIKGPEAPAVPRTGAPGLTPVSRISPTEGGTQRPAE